MTHSQELFSWWELGKEWQQNRNSLFWRYSQGNSVAYSKRPTQSRIKFSQSGKGNKLGAVQLKINNRKQKILNFLFFWYKIKAKISMMTSSVWIFTLIWVQTCGRALTKGLARLMNITIIIYSRGCTSTPQVHSHLLHLENCCRCQDQGQTAMDHSLCWEGDWPKNTPIRHGPSIHEDPNFKQAVNKPCPTCDWPALATRPIYMWPWSLSFTV